MSYPLLRLKIVLAGDYRQYFNWIEQNPVAKGEFAVFAKDFESLAGRQKENVELIKTGEWWLNEKGQEAIKRYYPGLLEDSSL